MSMRRIDTVAVDRQAKGAQHGAMPVGVALRHEREALKLSQEELAARSNGAFIQPNVSKWETGESTPGLDDVAALEKALGVNPGFLFSAAGYVSPATSTRQAIETDPSLQPGYRSLVLAVYDTAVANSGEERAKSPPASLSARRS